MTSTQAGVSEETQNALKNEQVFTVTEICRNHINNIVVSPSACLHDELPVYESGELLDSGGSLPHLFHRLVDNKSS